MNSFLVATQALLDPQLEYVKTSSLCCTIRLQYKLFINVTEKLVMDSSFYFVKPKFVKICYSIFFVIKLVASVIFPVYMQVMHKVNKISNHPVRRNPPSVL